MCVYVCECIRRKKKRQMTHFQSVCGFTIDKEKKKSLFKWRTRERANNNFYSFKRRQSFGNNCSCLTIILWRWPKQCFYMRKKGDIFHTLIFGTSLILERDYIQNAMKCTIIAHTFCHQFMIKVIFFYTNECMTGREKIVSFTFLI